MSSDIVIRLMAASGHADDEETAALLAEASDVIIQCRAAFADRIAVRRSAATPPRALIPGLSEDGCEYFDVVGWDGDVFGEIRCNASGGEVGWRIPSDLLFRYETAAAAADEVAGRYHQTRAAGALPVGDQS